MKFTSFSTYALFVAFSPNASSFVPNAARSRSSPSISHVSFNGPVDACSAARPSSELNLFGSRWRKTRQINSQSKVGKTPITESEVRGLFELWNSALATGDSRIVASRYTKVRVTRCVLQRSMYTVTIHLSYSVLFFANRVRFFCRLFLISPVRTMIP